MFISKPDNTKYFGFYTNDPSLTGGYYWDIASAAVIDTECVPKCLAVSECVGFHFQDSNDRCYFFKEITSFETNSGFEGRKLVYADDPDDNNLVTYTDTTCSVESYINQKGLLGFPYIFVADSFSPTTCEDICNTLDTCVGFNAFVVGGDYQCEFVKQFSSWDTQTIGGETSNEYCHVYSNDDTRLVTLDRTPSFDFDFIVLTTGAVDTVSEGFLNVTVDDDVYITVDSQYECQFSYTFNTGQHYKFSIALDLLNVYVSVNDQLECTIGANTFIPPAETKQIDFTSSDFVIYNFQYTSPITDEIFCEYYNLGNTTTNGTVINTINSITEASSCRSSCNNDIDCVGFTYDTVADTCTLFEDDYNGTTVDPNSLSYLKTNVTGCVYSVPVPTTTPAPTPAPTFSTRLSDGDLCDDDFQCDIGLWCNDDDFVPARCGATTFSGECDTNNDDRDCDDFRYCFKQSAFSSYTACDSRRGLGSYCVDDNFCSAGYVCRLLNQGSSFETCQAKTADRTEGTRTGAVLMFTSGCGTDDTQCPSGGYCNANVCEPYLSTNALCNDDIQCAPPAYCIPPASGQQGRCSTRFTEGGYCEDSGEVCSTDLFCDPSNNECSTEYRTDTIPDPLSIYQACSIVEQYPECDSGLTCQYFANTGYICMTPPTAFPTKSPTSGPTASPTPPTLTPTVSPTNNPTVAPTGNPTASPTPPTAMPTDAPTVTNFTFAPTTNPTMAPTGTPTVSPTKSPTTSIGGSCSVNADCINPEDFPDRYCDTFSNNCTLYANFGETCVSGGGQECGFGLFCIFTSYSDTESTCESSQRSVGQECKENTDCTTNVCTNDDYYNPPVKKCVTGSALAPNTICNVLDSRGCVTGYTCRSSTEGGITRCLSTLSPTASPTTPVPTPPPTNVGASSRGALCTNDLDCSGNLVCSFSGYCSVPLLSCTVHEDCFGIVPPGEYLPECNYDNGKCSAFRRSTCSTIQTCASEARSYDNVINTNTIELFNTTTTEEIEGIISNATTQLGNSLNGTTIRVRTLRIITFNTSGAFDYESQEFADNVTSVMCGIITDQCSGTTVVATLRRLLSGDELTLTISYDIDSIAFESLVNTRNDPQDVEFFSRLALALGISETLIVVNEYLPETYAVEVQITDTLSTIAETALEVVQTIPTVLDTVFTSLLPQDSFNVITLDQCPSENPCNNRGTCNSTTGFCDCITGFTGAQCRTPDDNVLTFTPTTIILDNVDNIRVLNANNETGNSIGDGLTMEERSMYYFTDDYNELVGDECPQPSYNGDFFALVFAVSIGNTGGSSCRLVPLSTTADMFVCCFVRNYGLMPMYQHIDDTGPEELFGAQLGGIWFGVDGDGNSVQNSETRAPTTPGPTASPTTGSPTTSPTTSTPTTSPTTAAPTTASPTPSPTTPSPTTAFPTRSPVTGTPGPSASPVAPTVGFVNEGTYAGIIVLSISFGTVIITLLYYVCMSSNVLQPTRTIDMVQYNAQPQYFEF